LYTRPAVAALIERIRRLGVLNDATVEEQTERPRASLGRRGTKRCQACSEKVRQSPRASEEASTAAISEHVLTEGFVSQTD
jgi:hypothetical protein